MMPGSAFRPWPGALEPFWWAARAFRKELFGFRFDYPVEAVPAAGPKASLHYYVYSDRLFFDAMELDARGIPLHRARALGSFYNPAYVAWYGLVSLERSLRGVDADASRAFWRQAEWLVAHAVRRDDGSVVWPYPVDFQEGYCRLKAPWICAMAQGLAISVLVRGYRMSGDPNLLDVCHAATRVFEKSVEDGGVRTLERGHVLYEEYPGYPLPRVLDGFLFSLLGLYDLAIQTGEARVARLFADGINGLRHTLEFWNYRNKWSWYGAHGYLCPPEYNKLNAALLRSLGRLSGDPTLERYAQGWDPGRRTVAGAAEVFLVFLWTKNRSRLKHLSRLKYLGRRDPARRGPGHALAPSNRTLPPDARARRLRVVVFTSGPLLPVNRVFFERLARDPLLDVSAIILDRSRRPGERLARACAAIGEIALRLFGLTHARARARESYDALARQQGIAVHQVGGFGSDDTLGVLRSLGPDLGLIVGDCVLPDTVISVPKYGTLNIHTCRVPECGAGDAMGPVELPGRDRSIRVAIYSAPAGPILREAAIPVEECDTLESLRIKADLVGANLYHETVRHVAAGAGQGASRHGSPGGIHRPPSERRLHQLEHQLKRRAATRMPVLWNRPSRVVRLRVLVQYAVLLPLLLRLRRRLIRERRAPIVMFFYHVVGNRPVNHMCIPLEEFVKQVEFLRRHYDVISLDQAVARLRSGENETIAASITFDDGYRDNTWALEYLRYFGIPASFFVSIGHVRDGSSFAHDLRRGFAEAFPMGEEDVRRLAADGFLVGSHGLYHEDFGRLDPETAERVLRESREVIVQVTGQAPEHFSFPFGQPGINITREHLDLSQRHYRYVYSAYGGYNFPSRGRRHFLRVGGELDVLELAMVMNGYTGFRQCLAGNAWGLRTDRLLPDTARDGAAPDHTLTTLRPDRERAVGMERRS